MILNILSGFSVQLGSIDEIAAYFRKEFEELYQKVIVSRLEEFIGCVDNINSEVLNDNPESNFALTISGSLDNMNHDSNFESCISNINIIKENIFTSSNGIKIRGYLKKDFHDIYREDINYLNAFYDKHDLFIYNEHTEELNNKLAAFGKILIEIFEHVLEIYEDGKRIKGLVDFDDLQLNVLRILENPGVKESLGEKYKYIMIDEYQDTNEIQYNIFMPILNQLNSGNLFIVGDEKQSIYMFRGAEPEIFNLTRQQIETSKMSGRLLNLPHSFRVSPKIALFTNVLFSKLFADEESLFDHVNYNELVSVRDETECGRIEFILKDSGEDGDTEADLVAKRILTLVDKADNGSLKFNDIAVLTRKRNAFVSLEKAFNNYNIPFSLVGGKGFFQKQAVHDIYNYLLFLLNTNNDLALIGILRSPFFTIPDTDIYSISIKEGASLYEKLIIASDDDMRLQKIISILEGHIKLSQAAALSTLLRTILTDTGYWAVVASKSNSLQEIANIEKLIGLSNSFIEKGFKTIYDFVSLLEESIKHMEDEGQANVSGEDDSVKIMTIHKAKGLEFTAVFLYGCNDYGQLDQVRSRSLSIDKQYGLLTKLPVNSDYFKDFENASINGAFNFKSQQKANGELKRLLYVAVTRSKDYLFITATHKGEKYQKGSFLELLVNGLQIVLYDHEINISGDQEFMISDGDGFRREQKKLKYKIDMVREINVADTDSSATDAERSADKIFFYDQINSSIKNEIVSATKIALFSQCPMKYHLTYNLGYTPLVSKGKLKKDLINFNHNEDEEVIKHSDIRGLIVHKLIELGIKSGEAADWIQNNLSQFISTTLNKSEVTSLVNSAAGLYEKYCSSDLKKEIESYSDIKSEFEIYAKENDYYLYGIMDKVIITENKIIIIDFKTDHNVKDKTGEKIQQYKNQIYFYGFIANKYFSSAAEIELRLVFLEDLSRQFTYQFSDEDSKEVGNNIKQVIEKIRNYDFSMNLKHCAGCHFEFNKSCVSSR
jgi:ATP-dependent helicase/nuclease subunit A